jgi:hypothetical protein
VRRRLAALATYAAVAVTASIAGAQERESALVVIVAPPDDPFGLRVAAELEQLGYRATIVDPPLQPGPDTLAAATRESGAVGAIRALPAEHAVEIWVTDPASGKTLRQELPDGGGDEGALALRSVELLRAGLVEVTLAPPRSAPAIAPLSERPPRRESRPDAPSQPPPRSPVFHVGIAPGVALAPGGLDPAATVVVGASWLPSEHVGLVALAVLPVSAAQITATDGTAELSAFFGGGGVRVAFADRTSRWSPGVDLGFGATLLRARTTAAEWTSSDTTSMTGTAFVRAGVGYAPIPRLRFRADLLAAWIGQGVSVRMAGREVATWGQPLVVPSLGAEIGLF